MSKAGEIPYTWEVIEKQVREAILCQASILESYGPWLDQKLVTDYLGLDPAYFTSGDVLSGPRSVEDIRPEDIDISDHALAGIAKDAYDYAYQLDPNSSRALGSWEMLPGLLEGFPQAYANGEPSPFCTLNDFPLRRMLETFFVRFALLDPEHSNDFAYGPSIRELALLSNMTVPAVRTSLSKEGFKLEKVQSSAGGSREDSSFRLNVEDARLWLSRRRGFIPQRLHGEDEGAAKLSSQLLTDRAANFPILLNRLLALKGISPEILADRGIFDRQWLSSLLSGEGAAPDVLALRRLARVLDLPEPEFAASAVMHLVATAPE